MIKKKGRRISSVLNSSPAVEQIISVRTQFPSFCMRVRLAQKYYLHNTVLYVRNRLSPFHSESLQSYGSSRK